MAKIPELWVLYIQHEQDHPRPLWFGDYNSEAEALAAVNEREGTAYTVGKKPTTHIQADARHYYLAKVCG